MNWLYLRQISTELNQIKCVGFVLLDGTSHIIDIFCELKYFLLNPKMCECKGHSFFNS